jgi:hypothetical protein
LDWAGGDVFRVAVDPTDWLERESSQGTRKRSDSASHKGKKKKKRPGWDKKLTLLYL